MNVTTAIIFAFAIFSRSAFGYCPPQMSSHGVETAGLISTTPLSDVAIPSMLGNLAASGLLLSENKMNTGKQVTGYTVLAFNGFPFLFYLLSECPGAKPVAQVPMTDEERSKARQEDIRATFWIAAMETVLSTAMLLQAEEPATKAIAGVTVTIPAFAALITQDKFQLGPARQPSGEKSLLIQPAVRVDTAAVSPGLQLRVGF